MRRPVRPSARGGASGQAILAFDPGAAAGSARERAILEQLAASDPAVSAFVEASAGSGKTKLLTDRLLRLMLSGADPARITCLTFTKAAAAEMALRLQRRLGEWATCPEARLARDLAELHAATDGGTREAARALFARVLDLPGGMRIGTIHAFCQSLLRRFPLEASLPPHFRLIEDADAFLTLEGAREAVLAEAAPAVLRDLAGLAQAQQFASLIATLNGQRDRLLSLADRPAEAMAAAIWRAAGARDPDERALLARAASEADEEALGPALRQADEHGTVPVRAHVAPLLAWLAAPLETRIARWDEWVGELLTGDGGPRQPKWFGSKAVRARFPAIEATIGAEQARLLVVEADRRAVRTAAATTALLQVALPTLAAYRTRKGEHGQLDYGDLIERTADLLRDPGAAWVLYKLDGGIEHLLLDEIQDTAPEQWRIAHLLTEEFFAGIGARAADAAPRTFFAVGDPKQSIYSFQGADQREFARSRHEMHYRVEGSGEHWRGVTLDVSFRSTPPVLDLVDAVFAEGPARQGVVDGALRHYPDRLGDAGRVELWPLAPLPEKQEVAAWEVPERNLGQRSAPQALADTLAEWLAGLITSGETLPSRGRALTAGDVLILVRRRTDFATTLMRALKGKGLPVAGLDRLVLTEQAAVQDLLAACDAVLLPEDDLAVACVLTSPLGGLSQEGLLELAAQRTHTLYDALRRRAGERPDWSAAWTFLSALSARADHTTPHALLAEMLGPLGGRARLLARLGPEAAEPIDELLGVALGYTVLHPPSLQAFVHWFRRSAATVKREAGGAGGAVRIMTVHGAKGLQAPLVILPDTTALPPEEEAFVWARDPAGLLDVPLWAPRKSHRAEAVLRLRREDRARQMEEHNRLLYVALTRAEDRLVVCGWNTRRPVPAECWYPQTARGFAAAGARPEPCPFGWGERLVLESLQTRRPATPGAGASSAAPPLPAWAGRPGAWRATAPPAEPAPPARLTPSRPDDVGLGPVPAARRPGDSARFRRGLLVHELLQHLPALEPLRRAAAARTHLERQGLVGPEAAALADEVLALLQHEALAPLFGPGSRAEQPITGVVGGQVVTGRVDRLVVRPDRIWIADYKSGREPPQDVARTPVLYLRQLAAYRAVLARLYPDRPVEAALVWTAGPVVTPIPPALLDAHAPGAAHRA